MGVEAGLRSVLAVNNPIVLQGVNPSPAGAQFAVVSKPMPTFPAPSVSRNAVESDGFQSNDAPYIELPPVSVVVMSQEVNVAELEVPLLGSTKNPVAVPVAPPPQHETRLKVTLLSVQVESADAVGTQNRLKVKSRSEKTSGLDLSMTVPLFLLGEKPIRQTQVARRLPTSAVSIIWRNRRKTDRVIASRDYVWCHV